MTHENRTHTHPQDAVPLRPAPFVPHQPGRPTPVFPMVVRRDSAGRSWLVDRFGHRIFIYSEQGLLMGAPGAFGSAPAQFHYPADVAVLPSGRAYILDSWNHRIQVIDSATWQLVHIFGRPGREPGELLEPRGIIEHNGGILVSERENHRLSLFEEDGHFRGLRVNLPGLCQPLTCPGSIARCGNYIVLLSEPQQALVLDALTLSCENAIALNEFGPPTAVYEAPGNAFLLSTLDGGIFTLSLDGTLLGANTLQENSTPPTAPVETSSGTRVIAANLTTKQWLPVCAPAVHTSHKMQTDSVAFSSFRNALADCTHENASACEKALDLFRHNCSSIVYQSKANEFSSLPRGVLQGMDRMRTFCARTKHVDLQYLGAKGITCAAATPNASLVIGLKPDGLARMTRDSIDMLPDSPGLCVALGAMPDGSLAALVHRNSLDILHVSRTGAIKRTLLRGFPPPGPGLPFPTPCARDENTFFIAAPQSDNILVLDVNTGAVDTRINSDFDRPFSVAFNPGSRVLYVLHRGGEVAAMDESGKSMWRNRPEIPGKARSAVSLCLCGRDSLFAVLAPTQGAPDDYSSIAELDINSGTIIRSFDNVPDANIQEDTISFEDILPPMDIGDGMIHVLSRFNRIVYSFNVRGMET